jgi:hypothetical protein
VYSYDTKLWRYSKIIACAEIFELDMGISHGFIFRPYPEWVHPLIKWIREKN